jgi:FAD/FMN-containing dehydrogenase
MSIWKAHLFSAKDLMLMQYSQADPNTPDWQHAFWGANYPRLLDIKRKVDPDDVFWCTLRWKR